MNNKTPTPHNSAKKEEFAKRVLLAGDPLRIKFIVEHLIDDAVLVNNIRGAQGYTGKYKGVPVSLMAHGMGNASMGIYAYELFNFYDVETIVRVGTCGAMQKGMKLKSILISSKAYSNTNYDNFYIKNGGPGFIEASKKLIKKTEKLAKKMKIETITEPTLSSESFYSDIDEIKIAQEQNLFGVEMECAALYLTAQNAKKDALGICMVSDSLITKKIMPAEERVSGLLNMAKLALEVLIS